jgi:L-ascorbate metabolism protein UlaG (beta-lactamase superfamily)
MVINWYGEGCFKIQTGGLTLLTDPFESSIGLTPPRGKNDIVLKTLTPWPIKEEEADGQVVLGGGEYEIQGINVRGFPVPKESSEKFFKTVYKVVAEEIRLGFLGHLSDELHPEAMQNLKDEVDILFVPAGGKPFIQQEAAAKIIKQLSPKIVVASFFKTPGLKRTSSDWMEKLSIRKKEIAEQKGSKLVVLKI